MKRPRLILALSPIILCAMPALAADKVAVRAAVHDGFARIALEWPAPVAYETKITDDTLTVHFSRALEADLAPLTKTLGETFAKVELDGNGTTLVAHLKHPIAATAFTVRSSIVAIDFSRAKYSSVKGEPSREAAAALAAVTPTAGPETAPAAPPAAAPAPDKAAMNVKITAAERNGVRRVVFEWPKPVEYGFANKDGTAVLSFDSDAEIDAKRLAEMLPELAPKIEAHDGEVRVFLSVPAGTLVASSHAGRSVTLSVTRQAPATAAKTPEAKPAKVAEPPPAAAKSAKAPEPPAAVTPPEAAPAKPAAAVAETKPAPAAPPAAKPEEAASKDAAKAADAVEPPPPATPPASVAVHFTATNNGASLRFDWPIATAAAIFRRGMASWIVFSTPTLLDLGEIQTIGRQAIGSVAQLPDKSATVLRLVARDGLIPSVRRNATSWIVDLTPQAAPAEAPIAADAHPGANPASVTFRVRQAGAPVTFRDPETGDKLWVIPVGELGRGVDAPVDLVELRGLASVQGIVLRGLVDDLAFHVDKDGVEVTRPGGLALSGERDRLLGRALKRAHVLFDFAQWGGSPDEDFIAARAVLERAIADAPQGARSQPRLALAQFYFAHLFAAETLAVIDAIGRDDPGFAAVPPVRALKGAACLLAGRLPCAEEELAQNSLAQDPEAALWRAAVAAEKGDWEAAAQGFLDGASLLATYPRPLRIRFSLVAATAMLETDRVPIASPLLELALKDHPDAADLAMATYLDGRRLLLQGKLDEALVRWDQVLEGSDNAAKVRARYSRALALFDAGRATVDETVKKLDDMRFAWRGDAFEFKLLRRLGEMKLEQGDAAGGLEALQQATTYFPDNPAAKDLAKLTADTFAGLFLGPQADDLTPMKSLALYDQFHDVEPAGPRSDAIVAKLIDRLVSVDLLDRAAGLLEGQAAKRKPGADKARATTQLALLRLMDQKPDAAQKALDIDVGNDLPPELAQQRQQLRARVQMDLGRPTDALAFLDKDVSRDADRLRADIYWRGHNWHEAAKTLTRLIGAPRADGKLDPETARLVIGLAAALTLDDDQAALAKLRTDFAVAMDATPSAQAFRVLAGDPAKEPSTDPSVLANRVAQIGDLQKFMAAFKPPAPATPKPAS
jgi:tetratricopeptide (TPR) repeat protein